MSKMGDLIIDIEQRLAEGDSPEVIAKELDIPVEWVYNVVAEYT